MKTFAYRLFPSKPQERLLLSTVETCRHVYNDCLAERNEAWENEQRSITKFQQMRRVKDVKATNPYAKDVHSHILQVAVSDLDKAFQSFFRRVKAGEKPKGKGESGCQTQDHRTKNTTASTFERDTRTTKHSEKDRRQLHAATVKSVERQCSFGRKSTASPLPVKSVEKPTLPYSTTTIATQRRKTGVSEHSSIANTRKSEYSKRLPSVVSSVPIATENSTGQKETGHESNRRVGYPRFKGRDRFDSFGLKEYGNGWKVDGRRLKLSGIGRVAVRWHRPMEGKPKTVRIIHKPDGWYACITCETPTHPLPATGGAVGIDVGLSSLITTSDGEKVPHPRWYREEQRKLRVLQRTVARRTKGGKNRRKAVASLKRQHQRIGNRRADVLNKLANDLMQRYDVIAVEDLRITHMVRNRHLAKSILDAGWGYFVQRLHAKAEDAARAVHEVNPAYTSQTCSACGQRFPEQLTLSVRWVICGCGLAMDRDENAARNILTRAGHVRSALSSPLGLFAEEAAVL